MNADTKRHFTAWTERAMRPAEDEPLIGLMLLEYENDPEYWYSKGWPALRAHAESLYPNDYTGNSWGGGDVPNA